MDCDGEGYAVCNGGRYVACDGKVYVDCEAREKGVRPALEEHSGRPS